MPRFVEFTHVEGLVKENRDAKLAVRVDDVVSVYEVNSFGKPPDDVYVVIRTPTASFNVRSAYSEVLAKLGIAPE